MEEAPARKGIQSVEVGFRLLAALQDSPQPQPLKTIAARAGLTSSAANNYLVSLVRTGLAATDGRAGHYRLGPAALTLGLAAMRQIDGLEVVRHEVAALRDETGHSAAVTAWTRDGPVSLLKQEGSARTAFDLRTGLLSLTGTAAGKVFAACLPEPAVRAMIEEEGLAATPFLEATRRELREHGFAVIRRDDGTGYASAAAPIRDWSGEVRFALSLIGPQAVLGMAPGSPEISALLAGAARATAALGGAR